MKPMKQPTILWTLRSCFITLDFVGDTTKYKRKTRTFSSFFLNYKPFNTISIRFARTKTLTRPDYSSIIPLTRAWGYNENRMEK